MFISSGTITSCKYKEDLFNTKRYNEVVQERDALRYELSQLKKSKQDSIAKLLNASVKNALPGFAADELSVETRNGKVYVLMSDKLLFKSGSAAVEKPGKDALKKLSDVLHKYPTIEIMVEGHTDNVPIKTKEYKDNWDLSVARAVSIVRVMSVDQKLNPERIVAAGRGEYQPKASNATSAGKARNRRTEIILTPAVEENQALNIKK
ncbi:MAG: OmpA/MotB family protein [Bacteroidia bacterium]